MSDSVTLPAGPAAVFTLEAVRKHAKRQLKRARTGDSALRAALRAALPRLAALSDSEFATQVKLADIHHALALEHGQPNWAALKRHLEALDPVHMQAARFMAAIRAADLPRVTALFERHPLLAHYNLPCAVAVGNTDFAAAWLKNDATRAITPHPGDGWEPLLYACQSRFHQLGEPYAGGSLRCAELLLDAGASPNAFALWDPGDPASKLSALYLACESNNEAVVRLLLERGADPNDGESIYHAPQRNHFSCAELLLAHGADISRRHPRWDNTPLYFMCGYFEGAPDTGKHLLAVRWLLEHGADPNVTSYSHGETPLHRCASFHHGPELAEVLLAHGAQVDAPRADGRTPYVLAVRSGNAGLAVYLLEQGAAPAQLGPLDALIGHAMNGEAEAAQQLAAAQPGLLAALNSEDQQCLADAAWRGQTAALRILAGLGFDLSHEGTSGGTALHAAAWHGNVEAVRILLELGAPVNVRDKTYGSSPLAWTAHGSSYCKRAVDEDYCCVAGLLLDAGADRATSINRWNEPPESMASQGVQQLLKTRGIAE